MPIKTLVIPIAFLFLSFLMLWIIIQIAKGKWWVKAGAILTFSVLGFIIWQAMESYRGWPTAESPPEIFMFIWAVIIEPNPKTQNPGLIYIWAGYPTKSKESGVLLSYSPSENEPRAHIFPYSRGLHEQIEKAKIMTTSGQSVFFKRKNGHNAGDGEMGPPGNTNEGGSNNQEGEYRIYDLPPSYRIPKD